jgi:uncharacterized coiled-coil DUF342 family protein
MNKEHYIETRDGYYRNAKENTETMVILRGKYDEMMDQSEKLGAELNNLNRLLSKMIYDIECRNREVSELKKSVGELALLDRNINKAKNDMRQLETIGKRLADMMKKDGVQKMTNMIEEWISYCNVLSKQIR